jgi:hypothetical protein
MVEPPSTLAVLVFWRVILGALGSIALALLLSHFIAPFTAEYGITVAILGIAFGVYWQSRADAGLSINEKVEEQKISRPIAFLGLALIGLVCGAGLAELFDSRLLGAAALLACATLLALWRHHTKPPPISRGALAFTLVALLAGYSVLLLLPI